MIQIHEEYSMAWATTSRKAADITFLDTYIVPHLRA
jgi:hypothetical protein